MKTLKIDLTRDLANGSRIVANVEIRGDDSQCSPGFSLCGELYEKHGTWSGKAQQENGRGCDACGQITEDVLRAFPQLKTLASLHLSDLDGVPMHAISNGLYFYRYARDIPQQYGFDNKYGEAAREGFDDPKDYARNVVKRMFRLDNLAELDAIPFENSKQFDSAFSTFVDSQRDRWKIEATDAIAWVRALIAGMMREQLKLANPNEASEEWSTYDLSRAIGASSATVNSLIGEICPNSGRYVAGASHYLYWLS